MAGSSILLLLACGGIFIQASPLLNANSNSNTNILSRRNSNANSNSNILIGSSIPSLSGYREGNENDESNLALESIRRKLYDENDEKTASLATAAGDAVMVVTKTLVQELGESIAAAVAEAVAQILRKQSDKTVYTRRNYNANSNTNIIGQDFNSVREPQRNKGSNGLGQGFDLPRGSGGSSLGYGSDIGRIPYARGTGGPYYDPEEEEEEEEEVEEEEEKEEVTTQNWILESEDEEEEKEALASKSLSGRGWGPINLAGYRGNTNSNANINQINFRRNSNGLKNRYRDDFNDDYKNEGLKSIGNRKNFNSNSNTNFNNFRRNINLKSNNFRRNINSNSNNNKIGRGYRYRRD